MFSGLDHVALVVADLALACETFAGAGFVVRQGGRHPNGSTNAFISFRDGSSLELFGFEAPSLPNSHRYWQRLQKGEGLAEVCLQAQDLEAARARYAQGGVELEPDLSRTRTRPDGKVLRWVVALVPQPQRGVIPFLLRDETPRDERVPPADVHPNGCLGIARVTVVVPALGEVRRWVSAMGGGAFNSPDGAELSQPFGAQALSFRVPDRAGPEREHLERVGSGLFGLELRFASGASFGPRQLHGAHLSRAD